MSAGKRPRVLFLLSDLEAGGAQRVVLTVARHLSRDLLEPHLGVVDGSGPLKSEIPAGLPVHDLGAGRVRYALPGLLKLARSLGPAAILSTIGHLNLALAGARPLLPRGIAVLLREANTPSMRIEHTRSPLAYRLLYRSLYPLADRVICNSRYMARDLAGHFGVKAARIAVIPNPVDADRIRKSLEKSQTPYAEGKSHLVSVGRLSRQKGFDLLIRAFDRALRELPAMHLSIVGEGPEERPLKRLARDLGILDSVLFAGHRHDPFRFMAHADLFVSSSRWEGSPNAVLESLACGTPVLAFDCPGGTGEIVREARNGWLVPAGDFERLGKRIVDVVRRRAWLELPSGSLLPQAHLCGCVVRRYEEVLLNPRPGSRPH